MQNVLLRFSLKHNLNVIVPDEGNLLYIKIGQTRTYDKFDDRWMMKRVEWHKDFVKGHKYDVMALHCIWNHAKIRQQKFHQ